VETDDETRESEDEELLQADTAHVDVDSKERGLRVVAADHRAAGRLH
jgi:hypothetical protein